MQDLEQLHQQVEPMIARLFPRTDESRFLHPRDIASIAARVSPACTVDWQGADDRLRKEFAELVKLNTPQPVLQGHLNLLGNVVDITIPIDENGICFTALPDCVLELQSLQPITSGYLEETKNLIARLGHALNYEVEFII